jgi:hypothetical protein
MPSDLLLYHKRREPMRSTLSFVWFVLVGIVFAGANVSAVDLDLRPLSRGGLNISLTTSGYRFHQPNRCGTVNPKVARLTQPEIDSNVVGKEDQGPNYKLDDLVYRIPWGSFAACVSLTNRSREAIRFEFNDGGSRWVFRILDSEDHEVWRSDSDIVSPQVIVDDMLGAGKTWKQTVRIPLVIDGTALAVGVYTLQAYLNADKAVSATSVFEVVADPSLTTGIKGLVLKQIAPPDGTLGPITEVPAAGVQVRVTEILDPLALVRRLPFTWAGYTNAEGRFTVNTPPGRFQVSVYERPFWSIPDSVNALRIVVPPIPVATAEVTVQRGAFSEITLRYKSTTPPPITQGISGSVWYAAYEPAVIVDQPVLATQESPLASTQSFRFVKSLPAPYTPVSVVQIDVPEGATPFSWIGRTDGLGRFQVATPPGRFKVDAGGLVISTSITNVAPIAPPNASAIVTVAPNTVTTVELLLYPGCVITYNQ